MLLAIHAFATFFLTGLIWTMQIVHYPLFSRVGEESYQAYQKSHQNRISFLVVPMMILEVITGVILLRQFPSGVTPALAWSGLGLLLLIWVSTALLQGPFHAWLSRGWNEKAYRLLVTSNWIRTVAWTVRSSGLIYVLAGLGRTTS